MQMSFSRAFFMLYLFEAHLQDVIKENEVILSIVRFFHVLITTLSYIYNCHLCTEYVWSNRACFWLQSTFFGHLRSSPYSSSYIERESSSVSPHPSHPFNHECR